MREIIHEVNKEYIIVEKLLDKVYNSMFTIQKARFSKLNKILKTNTFYDKVCIKGGVSFVL